MKAMIVRNADAALLVKRHLEPGDEWITLWPGGAVTGYRFTKIVFLHRFETTSVAEQANYDRWYENLKTKLVPGGKIVNLAGFL